MLANLVARLLSRLLPCEEINGGGRCPTYLYRWRVFRWRGRALYVHRFVGEDWSRDLHDHPKHFVTLMVAGGYVETTAAGDREYRAPWLRSFRPDHAHRVAVRPGDECWTLVLVSGAVRPWGFWHGGTWILWSDYVRGWASGIADRVAVCRSIGGQ